METEDGNGRNGGGSDGIAGRSDKEVDGTKGIVYEGNEIEAGLDWQLLLTSERRGIKGGGNGKYGGAVIGAKKLVARD